MNDILRIARLRIALQRAFLGRAILRVIDCSDYSSIGVKEAILIAYLQIETSKCEK